ncbi:MAG TPA: tRNA pseudouridine(38-40) synthase TruA [Anaerohalosphaeraceae bacterium]|jgi:tRNA pseudouridine38-40 synthase|nr:tRNA pseudouridine(38-40) synthase TruA [Anaerohalosphaeraceae bacterium]HRT50950.1 tRNA pseudouridine(38-40) synthase TruA [Anaerohalosphaeraceae bacterium]HRT86589.1 tRNA pseudouridine(38-40) synthase TruA [Anaerohalosphaeraceae bacterium]
MAKRRIKLVIHYDGTDYFGWQRQRRRRTIQQTIEDAIERLCGMPVELFGSSRTDAGVHALGQVAHFDIDTRVPTGNLVKALNNLLPQDIAIIRADEVSDTFDAISDTKLKLYRYSIFTRRERPVMDIRYCWHRPGRLDVEAMKQAAAVLVGTHDFKSFANASDQRTSSVRTVTKCSVMRDENWILIDVEADGFLYNMVRNIVGTLVEFGRGRWMPARMVDILEAKDRSCAGPIAPPSGLCLMRIEY